jgi:hypothetical protein
MEGRDEIIVLRNFDNSIDANIAKTKLDAYDIPCFLSDENLANLYPIQNPRFSGVRLHIFAKDMAEAQQVLDHTRSIPNDEATKCPRCRSNRVELDYTKKPVSRFLTVVMALFFTLLFPLKKVYHCRDCGHEFN